MTFVSAGHIILKYRKRKGKRNWVDRGKRRKKEIDR